MTSVNQIFTLLKFPYLKFLSQRNKCNIYVLFIYLFVWDLGFVQGIETNKHQTKAEKGELCEIKEEKDFALRTVFPTLKSIGAGQVLLREV